jgi:hypothetical protein
VLAAGFIGQLEESFSTHMIISKKETPWCSRAARAGCGNPGRTIPCRRAGTIKNRKESLHGSGKATKKGRPREIS